jgi:uncharacterized protein (TIGR01440 family)
MFEEIQKQSEQAARELLAAAKLERGDIVVVGCSTSEVAGHKIGTYSNMELAGAVYAGIYPVLREAGVYLAAQCCEHLNRSLVIERAAAEKYGYEIVNVVPQPKAGGSFATNAYQGMEKPVLVEYIQARAGIDIGDTLIGMHMARVAVPVRLSIQKIGEANLVCARVRPKFVGGSRAVYDEALL